MFTMPAKSQAVFTQQPKVRHYFTLKRAGYTSYGKQYTQRVFTMPARSPTVFTQQPKVRHYFTLNACRIYTPREDNTPSVCSPQTVFTQQPKVRHYYTLNACTIYTPGGDNTPNVCSPYQLNHRLCSPSNQRYVITIRQTRARYTLLGETIHPTCVHHTS